jgi:hypothetical protein
MRFTKPSIDVYGALEPKNIAYRFTGSYENSEV